MPVGVLLKGFCGANNRCVVAGTFDELQANGKVLVGESAGNRKRRQSAEIADGAEWIRKQQSVSRLVSSGVGGNRLRRGDQHVEAVEHLGDFLLQYFADLQCANIVRGFDVR